MTGAGGSTTDPVPCSAWSLAVAANTGNIIINASTLVDSYQSSAGAYGGSNVGAGAIVQAATTITNNGGVVNGVLRPNTPSGFAVVPVPAGATNLPLGSSSPGSLNINTAADSITLAPGNYVAANINVNFPGAINISPAGQVRIWVTGNLGLGGNENRNGPPANLAFLVTGAGSVNVNSNGALDGMIYAPKSGVTVNSTIFGSVIGSSISILNSGGAIHADRSAVGAVCAGPSPALPPTGPTPLPTPPSQPGCYAGTENGWLLIPCEDPHTILSGFRSFDVSADGLGTAASGGTTPPIVYGQVEATVENVTSEQNFFPIQCNGGTQCGDGTACPAPAGSTGNCACNAKTCSSNVCDSSARCLSGNQWGIQLNSNWFPCPSPVTGTCWDQFVLAADGVNGATAVCIETWQNGTKNWNDQNFCVGANGQTETAGGSLDWKATSRVGALQPGDYANVAAYAFNSGGNATIGMVAQFSWVSNQNPAVASQTDLPNLIPGLYAIVTPDQYNLAKNWTNVAGGWMGMDNSATSTFGNAELLQRYAVSDCQGDVSALGPTCTGQPTLSASNVTYQVDGTSAESNNLSLIRNPTVSFPNANLAVTDVFSSTSGSCLASAPSHLFLKDNDADNGGVPSNIGGVPFWESPDIFVLPTGSPKPLITDTPGDVQVTAGLSYDVYLRVHNEIGCNAVNGPLNVFVEGSDPNLGFAPWTNVTAGSDQGKYTTFGTATTTIAPAFGVGIVGPFTFSPTGSGHRCLLAAIAASNETEPPASATAPVLPPAYGNNQIAQRNLQIGSSCSYNITNSFTTQTGLPTTANLSLGIRVSPATPTPGSGGLAVSLVFADPGGAWAAIWKGQQGVSSVTADGAGNTTVVLNSSYVALRSVPLAAGASPSVRIVIAPQGTPPTVEVSSILTDPSTGTVVQANGGSCTGTQQVIPVVP